MERKLQSDGVVVLELVLAIAERENVQKPALLAVLDQVRRAIKRGNHRGRVVGSDVQREGLESLA